MPAPALNHPLDKISETELARLARVADPLLAGRPLLSAGQRPHRLRAGQGYEFLDHRPYSAGDDMRNLDWRATARSRHPQLRRFRDERTSDWYICLDRSASMTTPAGHKWDMAVTLTAALAYLLLHLGNRVALLGFSDHCAALLPLGRGRHHYARLARTLRGTAPAREGGGSQLLHCVSRISPGHQVMVVSDFLSPQAMQPALFRMAVEGCALQVIHVLDEADIAILPAEQPLELLDIESRERRTITPTRDVIASLRQARSALQTDLARFCAAHRIRYTPCNADEHWKAVITRHLKSLRVNHA